MNAMTQRKKRWLIISLLVILSILLIIGFDITTGYNPFDTTNKHKVVNILPHPSLSPVPSPETSLTSSVSESVYSPNHNFKLGFSIHNKDQIHFDVEFTGSGWAQGFSFGTNPVANETIIWKQTVDKVRAENYLNRSRNFITWSEKENKFAFLKPSSVVIFAYSIDPVPQSEFDYRQTYLRLLNSQEIPLVTPIGKNPRIFFSGDGSRLYYQDQDELSYIFPEYKLVPTNKAPNYLEIAYPIPNSNGVFYVSGSADGEVLIFDYGSYKKQYAIPKVGNEQPGPEKIIISPGQDKACIVWSSSGYRGYFIFDLASSRKIAFGMEYSDCVRWLSNAQIMVEENPYGTSDYANFIIDTQTGEKRFINDKTLTR